MPHPGPRKCRTFRRNLAQYGIDQTLEAAGIAILTRQGDGKIDDGMGAGVEEQKLGCSAQQDLACRAGFARQRLLQKTGQNVFDLAAPAQAGRNDGAHEPAIALGEALHQSGILARKDFVEWLSAAEDVMQDAHRHAARGQALSV